MPKTKVRTVAQHRPAKRRRRFRHDDPTAVHLFSGFGGLTEGIEEAGFTTILAANHNTYKVEIHEANHPHVEHWRADLVDTDAADYHDARDLPAADMLAAGVSCKNHSRANSERAYATGGTLFDTYDEEYESGVTRSERDRATANCVLHYAAVHHPRLILVECTTQLYSWGPLIPGSKKIGDGSTYRWWLKEIEKLGYKHKVLYLNSMFFGVGQSRNRGYWVFWDKNLPDPDLEHRPESWCEGCQTTVEARWTWKTGIPLTGTVDYGKQYHYTCPSCRAEVVPPFTPSLDAIDLSNIGTRIGDRPLKAHTDKKTGHVTWGHLAPATMERADRARRKFGQFPALLMPAKAQRGSERHIWQPMATQTSQQEAALLSVGGALAVAVNNYQGIPRGLDEALPTQCGSETIGIVSTGILPYRKNTIPTMHSEAMPTVTAEQIPALISATGSIDQGVDDWAAEWRRMLADMPIEDCYLRMLNSNEIGRGCGFDVTWSGKEGKFVVWGSERDRVDGYGNAVSPPVGTWIGSRIRPILHGQEAAA
ncbi:DNA cytosine methyltransferase [Kineosporia babensis]|uniref:DNA (cytosine-5-)-methyltransferase n=1 Tax=Kineosporia babensis TaxID=499548 RepID=A0A9X1NBR8_9ACTN|nr:DNA cytosine methyltransferase [Kineosporia babensis]MCD5310919.1 DNA cytosine methyltransferase [Kineosporia babensis]